MVNRETAVKTSDGKRRAGRRIGARKKMIFYALMMFLPCLQFCIFWIGVNANSILLSFQEFDFDSGKYHWVWFKNFQTIFENFGSVAYLKTAVGNSVAIYALGIAISTPFALIFSYYIYKNRLFSNVFKVVLFLPSIISSVVMVIMYKYFVDRAIPGMIESITHNTVLGLIANPKTTWITVVFYGIWTGFGTSSVIYSSTMGGISESIVEAAALDGITPLKEFWHITLPMIWPTFTTFLVTGFAAIFTNTAHLYSFFGDKAEYSLYTFGYYIYVQTKAAGAAEFPQLAALGLLLTVVVAPLTVLFRKLLNKFGPSTV